MRIEIVENERNKIRWLVKLPKKVKIRFPEQLETEYFVVSEVTMPPFCREILAFPADKRGRVLSWLEVAGGRSSITDKMITLDDVINQLKEMLKSEVV